MFSTNGFDLGVENVFSGLGFRETGDDLGSSSLEGSGITSWTISGESNRLSASFCKPIKTAAVVCLARIKSECMIRSILIPVSLSRQPVANACRQPISVRTFSSDFFLLK
uniref:SJCHGC03326 protein n=1 Tax=Schistosoma japonicum TaxID=6182 RepID=Q5DCC7_SCHJA|nr:SJCHGC03326 protein [Schistosoma japonicum]